MYLNCILYYIFKILSLFLKVFLMLKFTVLVRSIKSVNIINSQVIHVRKYRN